MMHGRDGTDSAGRTSIIACARKASLDKIYGMPIFQFFEQRPEEAQLFNHAWTDLSTIDGPAVTDALFIQRNSFHRGCRGRTRAAAWRPSGEESALTGTLYDVAHVVAGAKDGPLKPVMERCTIASGICLLRCPRAPTRTS